MKIVINHQNLSKWNMYILGVVVFLIRLPPVYLLPFHSIFFMSHTIARFFILVSFLISLASIFIKRKLSLPINKKLVLLLLIYFISQSISVLAARNIDSFLFTYKDLIFSLLFFISLMCTIKRNNIVFFVKILFISSALNLLFQFITYFFPQIIYVYLQPSFYEKYWQFFDYQFHRNRFFGDSFDEIIVPLILFYLMTQKKILNKTFYMALLGAVLFITFVSNWRSKSLMLFFALAISIFFYLKKIRKYIISITLVLTITVFMANYLSLQTLGSNIVDRLLLNGETETKTITSRITFWQEALEIGLSSPIIGIGLGNYYDNLTYISQQNKKNSSVRGVNSFIIIDDPHNLFFSTLASSGFLGLLSLLGLIGYFSISDIKRIINGELLSLSLIIAFWSLFIYAFFNPWMYFSYLAFFWFLRACIEKLNLKIKNE